MVFSCSLTLSRFISFQSQRFTTWFSVGVPCTKLKPLVNGDTRGGRSFEEPVIYSCNSGYHISGMNATTTTLKRTCQDKENQRGLSGRAPTCVRKSPEIMSVIPSQYQTNTMKINYNSGGEPWIEEPPFLSGFQMPLLSNQLSPHQRRMLQFDLPTAYTSKDESCFPGDRPIFPWCSIPHKSTETQCFFYSSVLNCWFPGEALWTLWKKAIMQLWDLAEKFLYS